MKLTLRPMSKDRLAQYLRGSTEAFVADQISTGTPPEVARRNASDTLSHSFPDGAPANGNEIFDVVAGNEPVGVLWLADQGDGAWFIYEIEIVEPQRGKGYGQGAMLAAEEHVRAAGGTTLALHVFATNSTARSLYESLGFHITDIQMRKQL